MGNTGTGGDVLVYDGSTWGTSHDDSVFSYVYSLSVYDGKLYAGKKQNGISNADIYSFDGSTWSVSYNGTTSIAYALCPYNGKLYSGYKVFDGRTWSSTTGISNTPYSLCEFNGKLYCGTYHPTNYADIYVYSERLESQLEQEVNLSPTFNEQYQHFTKDVSILGTLSMSDSGITNVGNIALDSISSDSGTAINIDLGSDAGDNFTVDGTKLVVKGNDGNVGINDSSPSYTLDVNGSISAISYYIISSLSYLSSSGDKGVFTVDSSVTTSSFAQPYYFASDGELDASDANDPNSVCDVLAITTGTGASKECLRRGLIRNSSWSWVMGKTIYLSEDPANPLTQTKPTTSGSIQQYLGQVENDPNQFYFDPEHIGILNP